MSTSSSLVAELLTHRSPARTPPAVARPSVVEQNITALLSDLQTATKIINEIFVETSLHQTEFARLKNSAHPPTEQETQWFKKELAHRFSHSIRSAIAQMDGPTQSVACYALKDHLDRFPLLSEQWTAPFVRSATVLEKFLRSRSPSLLPYLPNSSQLLTQHQTAASPQERQIVEQWQAALNHVVEQVNPQNHMSVKSLK